jgi:hypothetical protein
MAMTKVTLAERGTPILRHLLCSVCGREAHFLWNPAQEQYLCLQCRSVLYHDPDTGMHESRPNRALDLTKPWSPPPLPPQAHGHLLKVQRLQEEQDSQKAQE